MRLAHYRLITTHILCLAANWHPIITITSWQLAAYHLLCQRAAYLYLAVNLQHIACCLLAAYLSDCQLAAYYRPMPTCNLSLAVNYLWLPTYSIWRLLLTDSLSLARCQLASYRVLFTSGLSLWLPTCSLSSDANVQPIACCQLSLAANLQYMTLAAY